MLLVDDAAPVHTQIEKTGYNGIERKRDGGGEEEGRDGKKVN